MGHGAYSSTRRSARVMDSYTGKSSGEIFSSRCLNEEMTPKGLLLRESRDSEEHPNSLPIIIALDVTGSMGRIPFHLVKDGLTKIMGNIIQNGIKDPQILFLGIGDHEVDRAPLQVGQFESSDELLDKWLTSVYLEGGGGGNSGESYFLAWYAARYVKTDHHEKRGKKGLLFTIGDEPLLTSFTAKQQEKLMGNGSYKDTTAEKLLKEVSENWEVFHINVCETYSGSREDVQNGWKQLLKENCLIAKNHEDIPHIIARTVAESQGINDIKITDNIDDLVKAEVGSSIDPFNI